MMVIIVSSELEMSGLVCQTNPDFGLVFNPVKLAESYQKELYIVREKNVIPDLYIFLKGICSLWKKKNNLFAK